MLTGAGLGKTLQAIALIVADEAAERQIVPVPTVDTTACTAGTLVVAPVSVMSTWSGQIVQHVSAARPLRVLVFHGGNRRCRSYSKQPAPALADYDVVVTSYGTLAADATGREELLHVVWRRVVLDEAHCIRNPRAKASLAAARLAAASRWALTGTPIVNNPRDLYALVRFLRLSGGLSLLCFSRAIVRPLAQGLPAGTQLLRQLLAAACLRRTKAILQLPPVTALVRHVAFRPDERAKYAVLELEAQGLQAQYAGGREGDGGGGDPSYRVLLEILLRMRQLCNHAALCGPRLDALLRLARLPRVIVDLTPSNLRALQDLLALALAAREECGICLEPLAEPCITLCKHVFDRHCPFPVPIPLVDSPHADRQVRRHRCGYRFAAQVPHVSQPAGKRRQSHGPACGPFALPLPTTAIDRRGSGGDGLELKDRCPARHPSRVACQGPWAQDGGLQPMDRLPEPARAAP